MTEITILGGGIAGLSAGYFAKKKNFKFFIYEGSGEVGGNCRTIVLNDFKFDTGAHRFHDKDREMTLEITELLGKKIAEVNVPSFIFYQGKLIHFPLTPFNVFKNLSFTVLFKAVWHFFSGKFIYSPTKNFESLVYNKYGKTMSDLFLTNYSKKLWGEDCKNLSLDVAGSRLKNLNLRSVITEFFFGKNKSKHLEGAFFYPVDGFGEIARELACFCGEDRVKTNCRITEIRTGNNRIETIEINHNQQITAELVINTLPISVVLNLIKPEPPKHILEVARKLKFRHIKLVVFRLNKPLVINAATMYFPGEEYIFTRCYEPRNRSTNMSPKGKTSFVAEVPFSDNDTIAQLKADELKNTVKKQLLSTGLFTEAEIINVDLYSIPFAYPVLTNGYESDFQKLNNWMGKFENFYNSGRNGRFQYSWVHNMMRWGHDIVENISN